MSTEIDPQEDVETLFAKVDIAMGWAEDHTRNWRGGPPRQMGEARQALLVLCDRLKTAEEEAERLRTEVNELRDLRED